MKEKKQQSKAQPKHNQSTQPRDNTVAQLSREKTDTPAITGAVLKVKRGDLSHLTPIKSKNDESHNNIKQRNISKGATNISYSRLR